VRLLTITLTRCFRLNLLSPNSLAGRRATPDLVGGFVTRMSSIGSTIAAAKEVRPVAMATARAKNGLSLCAIQSTSFCRGSSYGGHVHRLARRAVDTPRCRRFACSARCPVGRLKITCDLPADCRRSPGTCIFLPADAAKERGQAPVIVLAPLFIRR